MNQMCVSCNLEFRVHEIGVFVITMFGDPPQPYKVHPGDRKKCSGCGVEVINYNRNSTLEHFQPECKKFLRDLITDEVSYVLVFEFPKHSGTHSKDLADYLEFFATEEEAAEIRTLNPT